MDFSNRNSLPGFLRDFTGLCLESFAVCLYVLLMSGILHFSFPLLRG